MNQVYFEAVCQSITDRPDVKIFAPLGDGRFVKGRRSTEESWSNDRLYKEGEILKEKLEAICKLYGLRAVIKKSFNI